MNKTKKIIILMLTLFIIFIYILITFLFFEYSQSKNQNIQNNISNSNIKETHSNDDLKENIEFFEKNLIYPTKPLIHVHNLNELNIQSYDEDTFLIMYPYFILDETTAEITETEQTYIRQVNVNNEILNEFLIEKSYYTATYYNEYFHSNSHTNDIIFFLDREHSHIDVYNTNTKSFHNYETNVNLLDFYIFQLFFDNSNVYAQAISLDENRTCIINLTTNEIFNVDIEPNPFNSYPTLLNDTIYYYEFPNIIEAEIYTDYMATIPGYYDNGNIKLYFFNKPINYDNSILFLTNNNNLYGIKNSQLTHYATIDIEEYSTQMVPGSYVMIDNENLLLICEHLEYNTTSLIKYNLATGSTKKVEKDYLDNINQYSYIYKDDLYIYMSAFEWITSDNINKYTANKDIIAIDKNTFDLVHTVSYQEDSYYTQPNIIHIPK